MGVGWFLLLLLVMPRVVSAQPPPSLSFLERPAPYGMNQFRAEAEVRQFCRAEPVVWVNFGSKVFHAPADPLFGKTRSGFYMCEKEATHAGFRPVKERRR